MLHVRSLFMTRQLMREAKVIIMRLHGSLAKQHWLKSGKSQFQYKIMLPVHFLVVVGHANETRRKVSYLT